MRYVTTFLILMAIGIGAGLNCPYIMGYIDSLPVTTPMKIVLLFIVAAAYYGILILIGMGLTKKKQQLAIKWSKHLSYTNKKKSGMTIFYLLPTIEYFRDKDLEIEDRSFTVFFSWLFWTVSFTRCWNKKQ